MARVVLSDATEDVWVIGPGEDTWDPYGAKPTVDLTRAVAWHRDHAVVAQMRFVDLQRVRAQDFVVKIETSEGFRRAVVSIGPGNRAGTHRLLTRGHEEVSCPKFQHDVDYGIDRVWMRIPRPCLDDPLWVRLAEKAYLFRPMDELADNPHNAGPRATYTERLFHP